MRLPFLRAWLLASFFAVLAGCGGGNAGGSLYGSGGGGSGSGAPGSAASSPTLTVAVNPTTVTTASPGTVTATITTAAGAPIPGQVVTFTTQSKKGTFTPDSALTNGNGVAVVSVSPANAAATGADQVNASATVGGVSIGGTIGFQLTATNVSISGLDNGLGGGNLAAFGQTTVTVGLAGMQGTPVNVSIASACVSQKLATLTPASVTTSTGSATFTYRDQGCGGVNKADTLQASVTGSGATASGQIPLTVPLASSIVFVSATPSTIFLLGSGYVSNATVTFQVQDAAGNPVSGQAVQINPTTLAGGLQINGASSAAAFPLSVNSDANGKVIVRVNSGTVPTPVRIQASTTVNATTISTVSSTLAIAVGLPAELNFSFAQKTINIEGYSLDGTANAYTVIASDRLGNPVPDGTAINFIAEGGQVQSIAFTATTNGLSSATAQFQTSQPRPPDGRVTVLAYALGNKSFIDTNGNNVYDPGEPFQDLGNPYLDTLYNGQFGSSASNQVIPQTPAGSGACNPSPPALPAALQLDASIPSQPGTCTGSWGSAYVRRAVETIFSTSAARPMWGTAFPAGSAVPPGSACPAGVTLIQPNVPAGAAYDASGKAQTQIYKPFGALALYVGAGNLNGVLAFLASDANPTALNPVAAGSRISVSAPVMAVSVAGGSPVPSTSVPSGVAVSYSFPATGPFSDTMTITITSPSGVITSISQFVSASNVPAGYTSCP